MTILVVCLLVAIAVLLCMPQADRGSALLRMALVGGAIWVIKTLSLPEALFGLGSLLIELAWHHRRATVCILGGCALLWLPLLFIWLFVSDALANRAVRKEFQESDGATRVRFARRVDEFVKAGYDRAKAESVVTRVANGE
jgi:hypothetical protein